MPKRALNDDGAAFHHPKHEIRCHVPLCIVKGQHFAHDAWLAPIGDELAFLPAMQHDILEDAQRTFDRWNQTESFVTTPTEHQTPQHAFQRARRQGTRVGQAAGNAADVIARVMPAWMASRVSTVNGCQSGDCPDLACHRVRTSSKRSREVYLA
jgi:hypothetical protein